MGKVDEIKCKCGREFSNTTDAALFVFAIHYTKQLFNEVRAWLHVKTHEHKIIKKYDIF